jgi:hypothetical protein
MAGLEEWDKLAATLDDDLRLIYPDMYLEHEQLFDKIMGVGYLIKDLGFPEKGLDWVNESQLNKLLQTRPNVAVLSKLLIVRLRLPWNEVNTEWLVSEVELNEHRDEYEVLEVFLRIRRIGSNEKIRWLRAEDKQYFDEHRDEFEVVEKRYSVRWKWSEEDKIRLLDDFLVTKDAVHEYLAQ